MYALGQYPFSRIFLAFRPYVRPVSVVAPVHCVTESIGNVNAIASPLSTLWIIIYPPLLRQQLLLLPQTSSGDEEYAMMESFHSTHSLTQSNQQAHKLVAHLSGAVTLPRRSTFWKNKKPAYFHTQVGEGSSWIPFCCRNTYIRVEKNPRVVLLMWLAILVFSFIYNRGNEMGTDFHSQIKQVLLSFLQL